MKIKINLLVIFTVFCSSIAHAEYFVTIPNGVSADMTNNLRTMSGLPIALNLANLIGDITLKGSTNDGVPLGTNTFGEMGASVTVTQTGSYSGSVTAGINAMVVLKGELGASRSTSMTGVVTLKLKWECQIINGYVWVIYSVAVNGETRNGSAKTAITKANLDSLNVAAILSNPAWIAYRMQAGYPNLTLYTVTLWGQYAYFSNYGSLVVATFPYTVTLPG